MKNASVTRICAFEVVCPHCDEPVGNKDNGSHIWMPEHIRAVANGKKATVTCESCGESVRFTVPRGAL